MNRIFYVPFETAKMLRAQGYPQTGSDMYYNIDGNLGALGNHIMQCTIEHYYAAPAYCEVLDWLVQKEIYIDVDRTTERVVKIPMWHCYIWDKYLLKGAIITGSYPTREEAINAAIIKVLEDRFFHN